MDAFDHGMDSFDSRHPVSLRGARELGVARRRQEAERPHNQKRTRTQLLYTSHQRPRSHRPGAASCQLTGID